MSRRTTVWLAGMVGGAALLAGCGEDDPPAVVTFAEYTDLLLSGAAPVIAKARPIIAEDENAILEDNRAELQRHVAADRALSTAMVKAHAMVAGADLHVVFNHPRGRKLLDQFLGEYEKLATAYEGLRGPYEGFLQSIDETIGEELDWGYDAEMVGEEVARHVDALNKRIDERSAEFLADWLRHARLLRIAGENVAGADAADAATAYIRKHELDGIDAMVPLAEEAAKISAMR